MRILVGRDEATAAKLMIEGYGDRAAAEAAAFAARLRAVGDMEGAEAWRRVAAVIDRRAAQPLRPKAASAA